MTSPRRLAGAIALVVLCSGCASNAEAAPVVLTIATDDDAMAPAGQQILQLADEVERRSDGALVIEPRWQAAGHRDRDWDQANAQLVIDGTVDMGLIPSRAWDKFGVDSLTPITAPFLITNDELLAELVASPLRNTMLAGLPEAGVTGIDLFPEGPAASVRLREPAARAVGLLRCRHPHPHVGNGVLDPVRIRRNTGR